MYTYVHIHTCADVMSLGLDADVGLTNFADLRYAYLPKHAYEEAVCHRPYRLCQLKVHIRSDAYIRGRCVSGLRLRHRSYRLCRLKVYIRSYAYIRGRCVSGLIRHRPHRLDTVLMSGIQCVFACACMCVCLFTSCA